MSENAAIELLVKGLGVGTVPLAAAVKSDNRVAGRDQVTGTFYWRWS